MGNPERDLWFSPFFYVPSWSEPTSSKGKCIRWHVASCQPPSALLTEFWLTQIILIEQLSLSGCCCNSSWYTWRRKKKKNESLSPLSSSTGWCYRRLFSIIICCEYSAFNYNCCANVISCCGCCSFCQATSVSLEWVLYWFSGLCFLIALWLCM